MPKIEHIIRAELNPQTPIPDIMQVIGVMLQANPGHEAAILKGVAEGVETIAQRLDKKEGDQRANTTAQANRHKPDKR